MMSADDANLLNSRQTYRAVDFQLPSHSHFARSKTQRTRLIPGIYTERDGIQYVHFLGMDFPGYELEFKASLDHSEPYCSELL